MENLLERFMNNNNLKYGDLFRIKKPYNSKEYRTCYFIDKNNSCMYDEIYHNNHPILLIDMMVGNYEIEKVDKPNILVNRGILKW